jgi:predicted porin
MNKKLIALAVAGAMAAPLAAQADVSLSGRLQGEIVSMSGDGAVDGIYAMDAAENASQNSGNSGFLKFAASEDLGGGLTALASYNMNIAVDNVLKTRDAFIGLKGGFGTVLAGRMSTPYKSSTVKWDPFLATFAQARGSYGMTALHNGYVNNALAYANTFGPVKLVVAAVLDEAADPEDPTTTAGNHATSLSVNAPVGPVELAFAYIDVSEHEDTVNGGPYGEDASAMKFGVKYNGGPLTAALQIEQLDEGLAGTEDGLMVTYLTGSYAAGANTFSLSYGMDDLEDAEASYAALGMKHAFSKTTSAHVAYRMNERTDQENDVAAVGAGLRVKF